MRPAVQHDVAEHGGSVKYRRLKIQASPYPGMDEFRLLLECSATEHRIPVEYGPLKNSRLPEHGFGKIRQPVKYRPPESVGLPEMDPVKQRIPPENRSTEHHGAMERDLLEVGFLLKHGMPKPRLTPAEYIAEIRSGLEHRIQKFGLPCKNSRLEIHRRFKHHPQKIATLRRELPPRKISLARPVPPSRFTPDIRPQRVIGILGGMIQTHTLPRPDPRRFPAHAASLVGTGSHHTLQNQTGLVRR